MIQVVLVEDELKARKALLKMLKLTNSNIEIVGEADSIEEAQKLMNLVSFDLLFLDIGLKDGNGYNLLEKTKHLNYKVIFTTANSDNIQKAFSYNTFDYLLKPIDPIALQRAVTKVTIQVEQENELLRLKKNETKEETIHRFTVKQGDHTYYLESSEIIRFEAEGSYTKIYTKKDCFLTSKHLKTYEQLLESNFIRTHKSHLICMNAIKYYSKSKVYMINGDIIPVSTRKRAQIAMLLKA